MEEDNDDNPAAGGGGESEPKSVPSAANEKVIPELTLVLIGDRDSIEIGSKNILLDHDGQTNVEQFSTRLYDFCGRNVSVINMLGLQNINKFPLNQGIHAFLLLLPNGLHTSHYSSGMQWLEKAFGKGSLAYVMTVVTHKSGENSESALTDLRANSSFVEKRFHTCTRSMMDEKEIIDLLEKIDIMVSENGHHCNSGVMCDEKEEQKLHLLDHEEETMDSSVFQPNLRVEELEENSAEIKCDPVNEPGEGEDSEKNDDNTGGESAITSVSSVNNENGEADEVSGSGNRTQVQTGVGGKEAVSVGRQKEYWIRRWLGWLMWCWAVFLSGAAYLKFQCVAWLLAAEASEVEELEENSAEIKSDPVNEPGEGEHSEKNDDNTGGESANNEKGEADEVKDVSNESSSKMTEGSMEESDAVKDTSPTSQTVSTATKELEELEENSAEIKSDPVNEPGEGEHSEKNDDNTGGESENTSVPSANNVKGDKLEENAADSVVKRNLGDVPGDQQSKNEDSSTVGGESENKPVQSETTDKGRSDKDTSGNQEQSVEMSEEINKKQQYQRETEKLFARLHLQDKQQKLTPADFLKIGPPVKTGP
ncbi:uncharacterized protein LOC120574289 [Perca fluviatilis]|uniref:uncharacterized protein LOC120574289 n=1 Tax=Perca fluviatilis TaxID=8168 RepID=UPI001965A2E9|nr:uncharacterized protein LOC120574289 [Perca fluviatilis]